MKKKTKHIIKNQTVEFSSDITVKTVDLRKVEELLNKRQKLIFESDKRELDFRKERLGLFKKIIQLDNKIVKAREGKTVKCQR